MELINELPNEIQFNVIKFMRHPVADLFKNHLCYEIFQKTEQDKYVYHKPGGESYEYNTFPNRSILRGYNFKLLWQDCKYLKLL
jgi:hypothetical protein